MAYITYAERNSLLQLLKTLKTDPSTIPCTSSSTIASSTSPVLESYYQRVSSEYAKPASVLRKEAEEALVRYEEEENVSIRFDFYCRRSRTKPMPMAGPRCDVGSASETTKSSRRCR